MIQTIGIANIKPKLVTFGIGLAVTFVIGTAIGMVEAQQPGSMFGLATFDTDTIGCSDC